MSLNKNQVFIVSIFFILFILLIFVGRRTPLTKKGEENDIEQVQEAVDSEVILSEARNELDSNRLAYLQNLELERRKVQHSDLAKTIEILKTISGTWYQWKVYPAAAVYAEQVALLEQSSEAWSITGTSFGFAFNKGKAEDIALKKFLAQKSIEAFQKAKQLDSSNIDHTINEATMLLDLSTIDAKTPPMKGIFLLRELDKQNPNSVKVNMTLGNLSFYRTGDVAKAIPRFEKVVEIAQSQPVDRNLLLSAHSLLIDCYKKQEDTLSVLKHYDACIALTTDSLMLEQLTQFKEKYVRK